MLYHTARISLNRPLVSGNNQSALSSDTSKVMSDAFEICDASVETIIGILRRFSTQHTLKNAPLGFVHGAVAAIDVTLAMSSRSYKDDRPRPIVKDTVLPAIDAALAELSYAWSIANDARRCLQGLLNNRQAERRAEDESGNRVTSVPAYLDPELFDLHATDLATAVRPDLQCLLQRPTTVHAAPPLDLELLGNSG